MSGLFVKAANLTKVYEVRNDGGTSTRITVFEDVSFYVQKGEVIGVIGTNGSGKSTLLKIIAGVSKPSAGSVHVKGSVASLLDIGAGFHPDLSGRDNVLLMGQMQGISGKLATPLLQEIIDFSEIWEFIDLPVKSYSKGMYLRLAFSTMIHLPFDIYLLDEVLSVGDVQFQLKCKQYIQQLALSKEKIMFVISHNYNELKELCTAYFSFNNKSLHVFDHLDTFFSFQATHTLRPKNEKYNIWKHGIRMQRPYEHVSCMTTQVGGFNYPDDIPLEIQFLGLTSETQVGLAVKDEFQQTVFQTYFNVKLKPSNRIFIKVNLPSAFFNQGFYVVDLFCFNEQELNAIESNVLKFQVHPFVLEQTIANRTWGPTKPQIMIHSINYGD